MSSSERGGEGGKVVDFKFDGKKTKSPLVEKNPTSGAMADLASFRLKKEIEEGGIEILVEKARAFLREHQKPADISATASMIDVYTKKPYEALIKSVRTFLMNPNGITAGNILQVKAVMHAFILESNNQKNT